MIALVDYGIGNLRSVEKAIQAAGGIVRVTSDASDIHSADQVVLPGVGAFGDGMAGLKARGLDLALVEVASSGKPMLGICLGMQLLFEASEELGEHAGLALLAGQVRRFPQANLKIPHTGWNQVFPLRASPLLAGLDRGSYAYFNHSYYCDPAHPEDALAQSDYGLSYACVVRKDNLYGVQFHPEKSQAVGLTILRNFVENCQ